MWNEHSSARTTKEEGMWGGRARRDPLGLALARVGSVVVLSRPPRTAQR